MEHEDGKRRRPSAREYCRTAGCRNITNERKDYCIDHIDRSPHAKVVAAGLAEREREESLAVGKSSWHLIDIRGSRAREIVENLLVKGAQTPERLAIEVDISPEGLEAYIEALERAKILKLHKLRSKRGGERQVVTLLDEAG